MGFGFNLLFLFILVPLETILLVAWFFLKKNIYGKILLYSWVGILILILAAALVSRLNSKILLQKKDFYGEYVIDRTKFSRKQADWQYNNFRFEIKSDDSIYFYVINSNSITQKFSGVVSTLKPYKSERLIINMQKPTHHIIMSNPTIYRNAWSFYLVFNSSKFGNVFFTKGKWKKIGINDIK